MLRTGTHARSEVLPPPSALERVAMAREHARALVAFGGEHAVTRMRKHVGWYITGMPGASRVRDLFRTAKEAAATATLVTRRFS